VAPRRGGDGRRGDDPLRVGVLISGTRTNLQALIDAPDIEVVCVVSSRAEAPGVGRAERAGLPWLVATDEEEIRGFLRGHGVELVVLAGYMRVLSPAFVAAYAGRILNVHPSLLPAFPGRDAIGDALRYGVRVSGVTVHFVDDGVDTGPVLLQEPVAVAYNDTPSALAERMHEVEHRLLGRAVRLVRDGRVEVNGRRVLIRGGGDA
jgi:phosphoribosylglycinamide formyltransferase 1